MKILWASPNTLLDTANGAALAVREILEQLKKRDCDTRDLVIRLYDDDVFYIEQSVKAYQAHASLHDIEKNTDYLLDVLKQAISKANSGL